MTQQEISDCLYALKSQIEALETRLNSMELLMKRPNKENYENQQTQCSNMTKNLIESKIYHIYWEDRCIMRALPEDEFQDTWGKLMWVYNTELNYVEITIDEDDNHTISDVSY